MIRYLSYVGPKDEKRIDLGIGRSVWFPRGQVVDVTDAGMGERLAMDLLNTGLFKLHESMASPLAFECPKCGKVCKNKAGLKAHMRRCSA